MNILIVEDQKDKQEKIRALIEGKKGVRAKIHVEESLRGGLKFVLENKDTLELIVLDMSMPNFDPEDHSGGDYSPESFAGKELLEQMDLRSIVVPVVVVTQYASFQEGAVSLAQLSSNFTESFPDIYLGAVYYNAALETWKDELTQYLP